MKKFIAFFIIAGAVWGYSYLNYHMILFDDSLKILKKSEMSIKHSYVDARGHKMVAIVAMPDLIEAGIKEVIGQSKGVSIPLPQF